MTHLIKHFPIKILLLAGLALAIAVPPAQAEDAYQWEDGAGHIFFGDSPPPTAKNVKKLNIKRYSKYSADKMLAPYKKYVRPLKIGGDLPEDGHDLAAAETGTEPDGAESIGGGLKNKDKGLTEANIDLPNDTVVPKDPGVPNESVSAGATGPQSSLSGRAALESSSAIDRPGEQIEGSSTQSANEKKNEKNSGAVVQFDPQHQGPADEERPEDQLPVLLEQGELAVKHNKKLDVVECRVVVFNRGSEQAHGVAVSFQFSDGTVIPGTGASTIDAGGQAEYRIPKGNLPVSIRGAGKDAAGDIGPIPMVLIQSAA